MRPTKSFDEGEGAAQRAMRPSLLAGWLCRPSAWSDQL
jgi:hypothetical protein